MSDIPTLEYRPVNPHRKIHLAWSYLTVACAALPFIGLYAWRILEAFHPLDVPPWNDLLGKAAAGCLALGLIAAPFNLLFAAICIRRYRRQRFPQSLSVIALIAESWICFQFAWMFLVTHGTI